MTSPGLSNSLRYEIAALTDKGLKRSANEDAYGLFDLPQTDAAIVVADGMGGLQAGDIASETSVSVMEETLRARITAGDTLDAALRESFRKANERVFAIAEEVRRHAEEAAKQSEADMPTAKRGDYSKSAPVPKSSTPLMGATVVAALIQGGTVTIAHAGDSRLYRLRNNTLTALTFDHSFVAERVRAGDITEAEARVSRFRNMITRAVGIDDSIQPEIKTESLEPGDTLLLCTDGLNTMIDDEEIAVLLGGKNTARGGGVAEGIASALVAAANERGGSDNITVVVIRVLDASGGASSVATTPAVRASASERPASTPSTERRTTKRPEIVDMEAKRPAGNRRGGVSPFIGFLAFVGVLALGITAILAASTDVRRNVGRLLAPIPAPSPITVNQTTGAITGNLIRIKDYTKMEYDAPVPFGSPRFSARGDLLSYSPKAGIFFVKDTSGQMAYLSKAGQVVQSIAAFEVQPPPPTPVPASRVFIATDLQGNSYISYTARKVIEKYNREGRKIRVIPSVERPEALTVDEDGNLYVIYDGEIKMLKAKPMQPKKPTASPSP